MNACRSSQLRFYSNSQGSYWIDDVRLALWFHRWDTSQDGCVSNTELFAFIDRWQVSNVDVTLKELMEAIGLWKRGC